MLTCCFSTIPVKICEKKQVLKVVVALNPIQNGPFRSCSQMAGG